MGPPDVLPHVAHLKALLSFDVPAQDQLHKKPALVFHHLAGFAFSLPPGNQRERFLAGDGRVLLGLLLRPLRQFFFCEWRCLFDEA